MTNLLFKAVVFNPVGLKLNSTKTWFKVNMKKSLFCLIMIQCYPQDFVRLQRMGLGPSMGSGGEIIVHFKVNCILDLTASAWCSFKIHLQPVFGVQIEKALTYTWTVNSNIFAI